MLNIETILHEIDNNIGQFVEGKTEYSQLLWKKLLCCHPADIAAVIEGTDRMYQFPFFSKLPADTGKEVFEKLSSLTQISFLDRLKIEVAEDILSEMPADKINNLFENVPEEYLQKYLKLLQKKQRTHLIASLTFAQKSAARIMNSEVLTFQKGFNIKKCIELLQRFAEKKDVLSRIYVTSPHNHLIGYVGFEDLLVNKPDTPVSRILKKNEFVIDAHQDQQVVAQKMQHYGLTCAPVVDQDNHFLGVVTADDVFTILEEEANEDAYKLSGLVPVEQSYFHTSFWTLIRQRSVWLVSLLVMQSLSSYIMYTYSGVLESHLILSFFLTMLIGTGGNAGNQSATLVIRGLTTGEINPKTEKKIFMREFFSSLTLGIILVVFCFIRVYLTHKDLVAAFALCSALFCIVVTSMTLGTLIPLLLNRLSIDPAHSAAPFLATMMDVIGILILCVIANLVFGWA